MQQDAWSKDVRPIMSTGGGRFLVFFFPSLSLFPSVQSIFTDAPLPGCNPIAPPCNTITPRAVQAICK
jgi:hypothetical protein